MSNVVHNNNNFYIMMPYKNENISEQVGTTVLYGGCRAHRDENIKFEFNDIIFVNEKEFWAKTEYRLY
jgi:hypothetical protein